MASLNLLPTASALSIVRNFPNSTPPPASGVTGGGNLQDIANTAADWWEAAITDDRTVTINFVWAPIFLGSAAIVSEAGSPPKVASATVSFGNQSSSTFSWFLDPTPGSSTEWQNFNKHYSVISGKRMNTGLVHSNYLGPQSSGGAPPQDLLTVALHEIGHALGMAYGYSQFPYRVGNDYDLDIVGGHFAGVEIPVDNSHIDIVLPEALMGTAPTQNLTRRFPSVVDILAVGFSGSYVYLNLDPFSDGAILEAEDAVKLTGAAISSGNGSSGGEYVTYTSPSMGSIEWEMNLWDPDAYPTYEIEFRYSLSGTSDVTMEVVNFFDLYFPNGSSITFSPTGGSSQWATAKLEVEKGDSAGPTARISLRANGSTAVLIDYATIRIKPSGSERYKVVQQGGLELALANDDQNNGNANAESSSSADDHLWEKIAAGAEWFRLRNKFSLRYLNVSGAALLEDANLAQWGGGSDDHYLFREVADGDYKLLQVKHSLGYVDTIGGSNGTNVQQTFNVTNRARWMPVAQGTYVRYVQKDTGLELALASDTQNNGNVNAETKGIPTDPADHIWKIEDSNEPGWSYLKNEKSNQYLNISGANLREGANAAQWPDTGGAAQYKVRFVPDGQYVNIEFKHSGQFLTAISGTNGTNVQQTSTTSDRARWTFVPVQ